MALSDQDLNYKWPSLLFLEAGQTYFFEYGQKFLAIAVIGGVISMSGREDFYEKTKEYSLSVLETLKES